MFITKIDPELPVSILKWELWLVDDEEAEIQMDCPVFIFLCFIFCCYLIEFILIYFFWEAYGQLKHTFLHSDGRV